jgi:hypothetical protein
MRKGATTMTTNDPERFVTVWSKGSGAEAQWVIERSFQLRYAIDALGLPEEAGIPMRSWARDHAWFEQGHDPNIPKE